MFIIKFYLQANGSGTVFIVNKLLVNEGFFSIRMKSLSKFKMVILKSIQQDSHNVIKIFLL